MCEREANTQTDTSIFKDLLVYTPAKASFVENVDSHEFTQTIIIFSIERKIMIFRYAMTEHVKITNRQLHYRVTSKLSKLVLIIWSDKRDLDKLQLLINILFFQCTLINKKY